MLNLLRRFRNQRLNPARYSFYVWENGTYIEMDAGEFQNDRDATEAALQHSRMEFQRHPANLDSPHLHVVRNDGVHIVTVDLPGRLEGQPAVDLKDGPGVGFVNSEAA